MYPNQQPPAYSVDYLNQISPQGPKKQLFTRTQKIIGIILGIAVISVILLSIAVSLIKNTTPAQTLAARLQSTETIVSGAQSKLKSSELRTLNSNLNIYLTNTNRDIVEPLAKINVNIKKLNETVTAKELGTDITDRLEDARLNATYDRTYAREIAYQLETIVALMRQIYSATSNQTLKDFLDNAYTNLEPTQKAFADFNAANG